MSIISQNNIKSQETESAISRFMKNYRVGDLLYKCNAGKAKGFSVIDIFRYLVSLVFCDRSMYMQMLTNRYTEAFGKNTIYRFLENSKTNWERFTVLLSAKITRFFSDLTSEDRADVFIIDDSLYSKTGYKKTELVSKVFDHVSMTMQKGFRMLVLGWSDGNSFVPILHRLLASSDDKNVIGVVKDFDKRSVAYKRRKQARTKATEVVMDMLNNAIKAGHKAKYVLFDRWFSCPSTIIKIKKNFNLDTIAMLKKSSKVKYIFDGEQLDIKQIFARCKKRPGRSRFLLSVEIGLFCKTENGKEIIIPAKIVCVRNRANRKDWLAIISTDTNIDENEIIRIYGKRWDIEVFFKTCKSMLKLSKECRCLSYDAMTAHVSIVMTRYMLLAVEKRINEDDRSVGELFFFITDELADITFNSALALIVGALLASVQEMLSISDVMLSKLVENFSYRLPKYLQIALNCQSAA